MPNQPHHEGLRSARLIMVLSSISPLFILWAIRGENLIPNGYFLAFCGAMVVLPNLYLFFKLRSARNLNERREITIGKAEDHRDHLLVYLFALLLPFYTANLNTWRDFSATLVAICIIVFLFWSLNLHYMNLLFAVFGYRVFTVFPPADNNPLSGKGCIVLITRRTAVSSGERCDPYRLSDTVYWEVDA